MTGPRMGPFSMSFFAGASDAVFWAVLSLPSCGHFFSWRPLRRPPSDAPGPAGRGGRRRQGGPLVLAGRARRSDEGGRVVSPARETFAPELHARSQAEICGFGIRRDQQVEPA